MWCFHLKQDEDHQKTAEVLQQDIKLVANPVHTHGSTCDTQNDQRLHPAALGNGCALQVWADVRTREPPNPSLLQAVRDFLKISDPPQLAGRKLTFLLQFEDGIQIFTNNPEIHYKVEDPPNPGLWKLRSSCSSPSAMMSTLVFMSCN